MTINRGVFSETGIRKDLNLGIKVETIDNQYGTSIQRKSIGDTNVK